MKEYQQTEGKHGPIYQIAQGVYVAKSIDGTWEAIVKRQELRKRKRFGHDLETALKFCELIASKLGIESKIKEEEARITTFQDIAESWLSSNAGRWTSNTEERYRGIIKQHLVPICGYKAIAKVSRMDVKSMLVDLLAIRSPKTVELTHAVMSGIFSEAMEMDLISDNPAAGLLRKILPPKKRRTQSKPDPFSKEDLVGFLDATWKVLPKPLALLMETMACTGMRLGEALAFHAENFDMSNTQYMLKEAKKKNGAYGPPKDGEWRLIDLEHSNAGHIHGYIRELSLREVGSSPTYIFKGLTHRHVQVAIKRVCKAAKLRARKPHDLRHTYASLLLMDHQSPMYVSKQLGHASISMTCDTYGNWIPGEGRKDLSKALNVRKGTD